MNVDIMSTGTYDSKVIRYRYMSLVGIILLIVFLVWLTPNLTSGAFYFLAAIIAHMAFVVTKSWFAEREYFGRQGPIDRVFSCNVESSRNDSSGNKR